MNIRKALDIGVIAFLAIMIQPGTCSLKCWYCEAHRSQTGHWCLDPFDNITALKNNLKECYFPSDVCLKIISSKLMHFSNQKSVICTFK